MFRKHFNASTVIAIAALVFAMTGGAFAITSKGGGPSAAITAKKKGKAKPKVKLIPGPKGATGPAGPQGPVGPQGPAGAKGENGAPGKNGENGTTGEKGANGESVSASKISSGAECKAGGTKFTVSGKSEHVCNGENGQTGFTETLPSGKTETGAWTFGPYETAAIPANGLGERIVKVPVASFAIPLSAGLAGETCGLEGSPKHVPSTCRVHYVNAAGKEVIYNAGFEAFEEATPTGCGTGTAAAPAAEAGNLCIYALSEVHSKSASNFIHDPGLGKQGAGMTGAFAEFTVEANGAEAYGTWAVKAE